jgi:hypothetical protein
VSRFDFRKKKGMPKTEVVYPLQDITNKNYDRPHRVYLRKAISFLDISLPNELRTLICEYFDTLLMEIQFPNECYLQWMSNETIGFLTFNPSVVLHIFYPANPVNFTKAINFSHYVNSSDWNKRHKTTQHNMTLTDFVSQISFETLSTYIGLLSGHLSVLRKSWDLLECYEYRPWDLLDTIAQT